MNGSIAQFVKTSKDVTNSPVYVGFMSGRNTDQKDTVTQGDQEMKKAPEMKKNNHHNK